MIAAERDAASVQPARLPVYFDYNSTTPVDPAVLECMLPYFTTEFGNASSKTHAFGWKADEAVDYARQQTAEFIGAEKDEIIFTSGATEAVNMALKGVVEAYRGRQPHIITVQTEHKAVLDTCSWLEQQGVQISYLSVNRQGLPDLTELEKEISAETLMFAMMYANNETGVIQPVEEAGALCRERGIFFFCDATQAAGKIRLHVKQNKIDLACFSAHKFYGPKGIGALYISRKNPRVRPAALLHGGSHENNFRSGTLNVPGIAGMGKACELAAATFQHQADSILKFRFALEQFFCENNFASINGSVASRLPNTLNICLAGTDSATFIKSIPEIAVATGSACTSASLQPSHVLRAMGLTEKEAASSIRFSMGRYTRPEEINFAISRMKKFFAGIVQHHT